MPWLALLPPLPVPPCCAAALFPLFAWFCAFKLLQETKVPVPDTQSAFWLEDCDWPMPWLAVLPPLLPFPLPLPPCCANALFPLFAWFCAFKLLHETKVPVPDTQSAFWL